ncbi:MAG: peptidylprolyl isomerase [Acidobacteriota bacterium]
MRINSKGSKVLFVVTALCLFLVLTMVAGCQGTQDKTPQAPVKASPGAKIVTIQTDKGDIIIEVYPKLMPITVANFEKLVNKGFYDNLTFHRVENWVIQGGDPLGTGMGGSPDTIKLETSPQLKNIRGGVAMARSTDPNSASSQFYILKTDAAWLDGQYAVFGKVLQGMDVVDSIQQGDKMTKVTEQK